MKHNLLKSVILSVILLMGVSNAWAWNDSWGKGMDHNVYMPSWIAGFDTSESQEVSFNINGTSTNLTSSNEEINKDRTLSNNPIISQLKITGYKTYMYHKNQHAGQDNNGANIKTNEMLWYIYSTDNLVSSGTYTGAYISEDSWINNQQKQRWGESSTIQDLLIGVSASTTTNLTYTLDFEFKATAKWYDSNGTEWGTPDNIWYPGDSKKFKYQFTIPKTTLTLRTIGANGKASISSGINNSIELNKEYSLTASEVTGYTFVNWTTSSQSINITNATSRTGAKVKFASFTSATVTANYKVNTSTITWDANGGSVTPTSSTYTYDGDPVALPTPTRTGYSFNGWFTASSGGTRISDVGKTNKPTSNTTYYAQWAENKYSVNITANPAEAAKTLTLGSQQVGINAVTISATPNIGYQFVNWTASAGITITNPNSANTTITATKAGTVTATFEKEPDVNVYLKANGWKSDGVRFAVYAFNDQAQTTWVDAQVLDCSGDYYVFPIPAEYNKVIFCRMNPNNQTNNWENRFNQTNTFTIGINNMFEFTTWGDTKGDGFQAESGEECTGNWTSYTPLTYSITLEKTTYGKYAIELNGLKYYSSQTEDVVIKNVPLESTLKLVSAESFNAAYNNNMCIQTHDGVDFEELNAEHRICGNTIIKENFTTIDAHTVYLRVSTSDNEINTNWNQGGDDNYIYSDNNIGGKVITTTSLPDGEIYKETGYNYYKFIIPAGCRTFRFEKKTNPNAYYASNTENFLRYLPLGTSNCYTIEKKISDNNDRTKTFNGSWGMSLANGDYRLIYVEQVVTNGDGNDSWKTVIKNTYQHSSDIIKKRTVTGTDIVSLHINYDETKHPRIILQQFSNGNWVDVEGEARMAVGPLTANPGRAMLPGRRNTESLTHDDGIEEIKQDKAVNGYAGRVWNFTVQQTVDNGNVTANLLFDPINAMEGSNLEPYSGNYYIRTDNAEGGWMDYTIPDNHMHFSQYALENSGFSHYFCKWVETSKKKNTKFVIANDYGAAISDPLSKDDYTDEHGNIADDANIRWSWNEYTNEAARAYIQGTWQTGTQNRNRNLVVNYKESSSAGAKEELLDDSGDWIYQKDFTVYVGSHLNSLTAQYPVNTGTTQTFAENLDMLTGDNNNHNAYVVRVLYDFKINKTLIALVPNEHKAEIAIDVMIERINQEKPATQVRADITYTNNQRSGEGSTVYAVMSFTKAHLTNEELSNEEKLTYWFSVPFNVTLSDVFGFGEVGQYWMIKYYDGEDRADKGLIDDNTFWKYITKKSTVLQANTGYVLALNKKVMDPNSPIFTNTDKISLYFPSTEPIQMIGTGYTVENCTIPSHTCTLQNREIYDSNWNFIGVPSYADKNITTNTTNVKYFYDYNHKTDKYTVTQNVDSKTFNSMFAYMVQFAGIINWESFTFNEGAQGLAAKRNTDSDAKQHNMRLELQQNGTTADKTFIQLQDEDATQMFDMNSDLCKIINAGSNIYSIISTESTPVNVAGNVLPIQETVIPVGVVISTAGEYTFAMPDGTDGIVVELIDYETNTTTNLLLDNYTVNLGKGTFDNRFALHVQPSKVTTSVGEINTNTTGVKKYLIDGVLYMQKDGVLYDAQGRCVQ